MNLSREKTLIKSVDWDYLVSRTEMLLCRSIHDNANLNFQKSTALSWRPKAILRVQEGDIFHHPEDLPRLGKLLKDRVEDFVGFKNKLLKSVARFEKVAKRIEKTDCPKLTNTQLAQLFDGFFKAAMDAPNFLTPIVLVDKLISSRILKKLPTANEEQKQKWLRVLAFPKKENSHTEEERDFLKLVIARQERRKNFEKLLKKHLAEYSWIGARGYRWHLEWTEASLLERIGDYLAQGQSAQKDLLHLKKLRAASEKDCAKLISRLKTKKNSETFKLIGLAKEYAYLRTWRTDVIYRAGFRCRNMFYEIARRSSLAEKDILFLSILEIKKMTGGWKIPISLKELNARKKYFITLLLDGHYRVYSGLKWKKTADEIRKRMLVGQTGNLVKGTPAFPGTVTGPAKLVFSGEDLQKVRPNDILLAVMTFPHYIAAMQRAAGFVTDEGGILCHAAIVAREMKKPCVIGTKIATKIFKDGDIIEIDANQGVVRKIS